MLLPSHFFFLAGYCDGSRSIVNGSGLNASVAGESLSFSIYLKDAYGYPSSVQVNILQVRIIHEVDSSDVLPTIKPRETLNGTKVLYEKHGIEVRSFICIMCLYITPLNLMT